MSGRIRTIKPELLEDEKTAALAHDEWRVFVSLLLVADDYGNCRANPELLEGQILWGARPSRDFREILAKLSDVSLVSLYTVRGQAYLHVVGWEKHQKVDKPGKPRCPAENEADPQDSRDSRESLARVSRLTPTPTPTPTTDHRPGARAALGPKNEPGTAAQSTQTTNHQRSAVTDPNSGDSDSSATTPAKSTQNAPQRRTEAKPEKWSRVPENWAPTFDHVAMAASLRVDLATEEAKFRDHEFRTPKTDANAAFRTWLRNASQFASGRGVQQTNHVQAAFDRAARLKAEEQAAEAQR